MAKRMSATLALTMVLCFFLYNPATSADDGDGWWQYAPSSFDPFLAWFTEDETFQRSVTAEIVKVTAYDAVDSEVSVHRYSRADLFEKGEHFFANRRD